MSADQPPLPFGRTLDEARADRDAAMLRVAEAAPEGWSDHAFELVVAYAAAHEFLFPAEWWAWAVARGLAVPPQPRAIGPVIKRAATRGVLRSTGAFAPSSTSHASPKQIWRCVPFTGERTGEFRGQRIEMRKSA